MVFAGQDKWRKHPLIYQCYKKPLPGLGTAVAIFATYLIVEFTVKHLTQVKSDPNHRPKPKYKFVESGDFGDSLPEAHAKGGHHH